MFRKYYESETRSKDSDNIYYNYRKNELENKSSLPSKLWDFICWSSCGYGLRPCNTIACGIVIIVFFSFIYTNPLKKRSVEIHYKQILLRFHIKFFNNINEGVKIPLPSWNVSWEKGSNKIIPVLSFKNPAIVKDCKKQNQNEQNQNKASLLDIFGYSVRTFTFMSHGKWYHRENFWKWVILEGVLGWITLGVLMATITNILIRT